jgi:hypothetical protein
MMTALLVHRRKANAVVAPTVRHFDDFCFSEFQSNRFRSAEAEMTRGKKKKKTEKDHPPHQFCFLFLQLAAAVMLYSPSVKLGFARKCQNPLGKQLC